MDLNNIPIRKGHITGYHQEQIMCAFFTCFLLVNNEQCRTPCTLHLINNVNIKSDMTINLELT